MNAMSDLKEYIALVCREKIEKLILSKASNGEYKKVVYELKSNGYQISKYTDKQVFHENISVEILSDSVYSMAESHYRQINAFEKSKEHIILISKKGICNYKTKRIKDAVINSESHNRKKNYILSEGIDIAPLVDMGVFTKEGTVVNAMYDKYRQLNRFIEIIDDEVSKCGLKEINVIDFGCGKSYLTFVVYYYLKYVRQIDVKMIGLDLKADVISKCNEAAKKYGYDSLRFEVGDINGFNAPFEVDMVITLHACDTATDYALYNAVNWNAKMIFSVPCCQHELNKQMKAQNLDIMSKYGIIKERFCSLATDAVRGNMLEYRGYKVQLLEFIDFEHTPKNILIRAVRKPVMPKAVKDKALLQAKKLMEEFAFEPTIYKLLS